MEIVIIMLVLGALPIVAAVLLDQGPAGRHATERELIGDVSNSSDSKLKHYRC